MPRLVATVFGRVQGVAFRYFVHSHARRLDLGGYVRNRADGYSVEVCAEGRREDLDSLLEQLHVAWPSGTGEFTDFTIRT